jgi:hypothetical protein
MSFLERNFIFACCDQSSAGRAKDMKIGKTEKRSLNRVMDIGAIIIFVSVRLLIFSHNCRVGSEEVPKFVPASSL